jgi:hypothetical protein
MKYLFLFIFLLLNCTFIKTIYTDYDFKIQLQKDIYVNKVDYRMNICYKGLINSCCEL